MLRTYFSLIRNFHPPRKDREAKSISIINKLNCTINKFIYSHKTRKEVIYRSRYLVQYALLYISLIWQNQRILTVWWYFKASFIPMLFTCQKVISNCLQIRMSTEGEHFFETSFFCERMMS